jgi:hypothetical protein
MLRLQCTYQRFTEEYVLYELPLIKGWLYYGYAVSNDPLNRFGGITLSRSPMSVEADDLYNELQEMIKKSSN